MIIDENYPLGSLQTILPSIAASCNQPEVAGWKPPLLGKTIAFPRETECQEPIGQIITANAEVSSKNATPFEQLVLRAQGGLRLTARSSASLTRQLDESCGDAGCLSWSQSKK
jgi:hypothetical protein